MEDIKGSLVFGSFKFYTDHFCSSFIKHTFFSEQSIHPMHHLEDFVSSVLCLLPFIEAFVPHVLLELKALAFTAQGFAALCRHFSWSTCTWEDRGMDLWKYMYRRHRGWIKYASIERPLWNETMSEWKYSGFSVICSRCHQMFLFTDAAARLQVQSPLGTHVSGCD